MLCGATLWYFDRRGSSVSTSGARRQAVVRHIREVLESMQRDHSDASFISEVLQVDGAWRLGSRPWGDRSLVRLPSPG
jgi:hypothetical protein